jgi:hypothetical protein
MGAASEWPNGSLVDEIADGLIGVARWEPGWKADEMLARPVVGGRRYRQTWTRP